MKRSAVVGSTNEHARYRITSRENFPWRRRRHRRAEPLDSWARRLNSIYLLDYSPTFETERTYGITAHQLVDLSTVETGIAADRLSDLEGMRVCAVGMREINLESDLVHPDTVPVEEPCLVVENAVICYCVGPDECYVVRNTVS